MSTLYYGDNLDVLKRHIRDEFVDLIYPRTLRSKAVATTMFCSKNRTAQKRPHKLDGPQTPSLRRQHIEPVGIAL